jgi:uncharacterized damage-inducible protein DinB
MASHAQRIAGRFMAHRGALISLARQLPESAAGYKPWDRAMSMLELLTHIAGTGEFFLPALLGREPLPIPSTTTVAEAAQALESLAEQEAEQIGALTDEQLAKVTTFAPLNLTLPVADLLTTWIDHEIHHKGQAWVYARLVGIQPPSFVSM